MVWNCLLPMPSLNVLSEWITAQFRSNPCPMYLPEEIECAFAWNRKGVKFKCHFLAKHGMRGIFSKSSSLTFFQQSLLSAPGKEGGRTHRLADSGKTAGWLHSHLLKYISLPNIFQIYITFKYISNIYHFIKHFRFTSGWGWFDTKSATLGEF